MLQGGVIGNTVEIFLSHHQHPPLRLFSSPESRSRYPANSSFLSPSQWLLESTIFSPLRCRLLCRPRLSGIHQSCPFVTSFLCIAYTKKIHPLSSPPNTTSLPQAQRAALRDVLLGKLWGCDHVPPGQWMVCFSR